MKHVLIASLAATALFTQAQAFAADKAATPPAAPSAAMTPAGGVSLATLTPEQLPAQAQVVTQDQAELSVTTVFKDKNTGKVSALMIAPAGSTAAKKIPATQIALADGKIVVAMTKAAFEALPAAS